MKWVLKGKSFYWNNIDGCDTSGNMKIMYTQNNLEKWLKFALKLSSKIGYIIVVIIQRFCVTFEYFCSFIAFDTWGTEIKLTSLALKWRMTFTLSFPVTDVIQLLLWVPECARVGWNVAARWCLPRRRQTTVDLIRRFDELWICVEIADWDFKSKVSNVNDLMEFTDSTFVWSRMPHSWLSRVRRRHLAVSVMMKTLIQTRSWIVDLIELIEWRECWLMTIHVRNRSSFHHRIPRQTIQISIARHVDFFISSTHFPCPFFCKIRNTSSQPAIVGIVYEKENKTKNDKSSAANGRNILTKNMQNTFLQSSPSIVSRALFCISQNNKLFVICCEDETKSQREKYQKNLTAE